MFLFCLKTIFLPAWEWPPIKRTFKTSEIRDKQRSTKTDNQADRRTKKQTKRAVLEEKWKIRIKKKKKRKECSSGKRTHSNVNIPQTFHGSSQSRTFCFGFWFGSNPQAPWGRGDGSISDFSKPRRFSRDLTTALSHSLAQMCRTLTTIESQWSVTVARACKEKKFIDDSECKRSAMFTLLREHSESLGWAWRGEEGFGRVWNQIKQSHWPDVRWKDGLERTFFFLVLNIEMYGWMYGWMDGCMGGWMGGWTGGCMGGWMDVWVDGWVGR